MKTLQIHRARKSRRGAALVYASILAVAMVTLGMALLMMNLGTGKLRVQTRDLQRSFYAAEAGLSDAYMRLTEGALALPEPDAPVFVGTSDAPIALGTGSYWVEIEELDIRSYSLRSTGTDGRAEDRLELVLAQAPNGFFQYAAFGADGVVLDSNAFIDSYDSALGAYVDQIQGGTDYAKENGHVGSNQDIDLGSNTEIHGDATPGPGHVVDDSAPGAYVSGSTDPADEEFEMVPIDVPVIPSSGTLPGGSSVTLGPGEIHYDKIQMMGGTQLTIVGPAVLVADDFTMMANSELIFETSGGPVELYGTGDFVLKSNSVVTTLSDSAVDVALLLSGDNMGAGPHDTVELSSNSEYIGAIYAPNAEFSLGSNFDVYGSVICGFLDLSSNGEIHFDEALLYDGWGASDDYEAALWRRLGDATP